MEEEFYIINPPGKFKNYCGIHTISRMNNFTLVDLKSRGVFSPGAFNYLIKKILIKLIQLIRKV